MITMVVKKIPLILFAVFNLSWIGKCHNTGTNQEEMSDRAKLGENNRIEELDAAESNYIKKNQDKTGKHYILKSLR